MRTILMMCLIVLGAACTPAQETGGKASKNTSSLLAGLDHRAGFFDIYVDEDKGKVLARLPEADEEGVSLRLIYTARLTAGLGSNPVGLDRGWGDGGRIVNFRRIGDKIVVEAENWTYRADPANPLEQRAVAESFARSFLWATPILNSKDGIVIDLSGFLKRDTLGIVEVLKDSEQGNFKLAKDRTLIDAPNVFAFPDNVEMDVFLTLTSSAPGREVATTAADGNAVTLIQHHSFVRLPEAGYQTRPSDPRAGVIERVYFNYSAPLTAPIQTRLARRYRLEKTQPDQERSPVKKPIVFYIDSGVPEPMLSALLDGARWWESAFEAAGYTDAYRVEVLPEGVHPLDVRYNVVQWVHRQTRGWSYGGGVSDPRTGEMLKGHVNLGSLRVRQDRMIFEGLAGTAKTGSGEMDDPVQLALARIRQLAAHEVGHALGFAHNFAASGYNGSVMDYPAPNVVLTNGVMDFSDTYGVGVGPWDMFTANWLYGDNTSSERDVLVQAAIADGLVYVADSNGRSIGTGHPAASTWDNGNDPVASLENVLAVRRVALDNFGPANIQAGQPHAQLNTVIVPIYLYHRYQMAAAAKLIGGMSFNYALAGDGQAPAQIVPAARQRAALDAILRTLEPTTLDIKDDVLQYLTPSLGSFSFTDSTRELFSRTAYPAFDVTAAADTAADLTFDVLFHPRRATRLVEFKRRDSTTLGLTQVFSITRSKVMGFSTTGRTGEIAKTVQTRYAYALMDLASGDVPPSVKTRADKALSNLVFDLRARRSDHASWLIREITRFKSRPITPVEPVASSKTLPPGSPIGMGIYENCWHCDL